MPRTLLGVLKSRKVSKVSGYCSYKFVVGSAQSIYHQIKMLNFPYDTLLEIEKKTSLKSVATGEIMPHEFYDWLILEALNSELHYPVYCVDQNLCESLYNTNPFILSKTDGIKRVPTFNSFADKGIVLMPKSINGVKPKTAAYIFKKYKESFKVSCLGWNLGQRGCEAFFLESVNPNNIINFNPNKKDAEEADNAIGFLINLFLYQDSVKDKMQSDFSIDGDRKVIENRKQKKTILHPRIIGKGYKPKSTYQNKTIGENTRNSPQTHWRSGHWRWQPFGKKEDQKYKTIWIEPVLVNA